VNGTEKYSVRVIHCDHRASDEQVYAALCRAPLPLSRAWRKLEVASKVLIKMNITWRPDKIRHFAGWRQELVDEAVVRGVDPDENEGEHYEIYEAERARISPASGT